MEETIGYEALFNAEEWDSLQLGGWDGPAPKHTVTIWYPPGESDVTENAYELECDICKTFASAETEEQADVMARLHEVLKVREIRSPERGWLAPAEGL